MRKKLLVAAVIGLSGMACQSKFQEDKGYGHSVPDQTKIELETNKKDIIERTQRAIEVIDAISYAVQQIRFGQKKLTSESEIMALIIESTSYAHAKSHDNTYVGNGFVNLPKGLVADDCRRIDTQSIYSGKKDSFEQKISVKTCQTGESYSEIVHISGSSDGKISVISKRNLSDVLPKSDLGNFLTVQNCDVKKEGEDLSTVSCNAGDLKISETDRLVFNDFSYVRDRDPVFRIEATHISGLDEKDRYLFEIDSEGKFFSKVIKK